MPNEKYRYYVVFVYLKSTDSGSALSIAASEVDCDGPLEETVPRNKAFDNLRSSYPFATPINWKRIE